MQDTSSRDDRHEAAAMLLPWYTTDRLDPAERAMVEAHLRDCSQCRAALAVDARLADMPVAPVPTPDAGWTAIQGRLAGAAMPLHPPVAPRERDRRRWAPAARPDVGRQRLRWVVAAQSAALMLIVGWIATVPAMRPPSREPAYRALSSGGDVRTGNVLAMFRPTTTEAELRRVLQASAARVVDGPTSAGAYVLAVPGGPGGSGLLTLRHDPAVTMAEPINAEETP